MFNTEQYYEGKVFLKSYADAIECIKYTRVKSLIFTRQSAEKTESVNTYTK